jgi:mono/diheme cytochrome c family protein
LKDPLVRRVRLSFLRPPALTILLVGYCSSILPACRHIKKTPAERGEGIFLRSCAGCHGPDARGTHPPGFVVAPRDLTDPALQTRLDDAALRETIHFGKGQMPAFGAALVEGDMNDLVTYVRSRKRAVP